MEKIEKIEEQIERNIDVIASTKELQSDIGLAEFLTANEPRQVQDFVEKLDAEKLKNYRLYFQQHAKQIEALERVNFYEVNIKYAHYTMLLIGVLSLLTTHFYRANLMHYLNNYDWLQYTFFASVPMAFFNFFNAISFILRLKKNKEVEEDDNEDYE